MRIVWTRALAGNPFTDQPRDSPLDDGIPIEHTFNIVTWLARDDARTGDSLTVPQGAGSVTAIARTGLHLSAC